MEIATPTIQDGIASLLELGVDEIVCHPFFLSPGRHVQEDIPRIVKDAIDALKVSIPVKTSAHVGSQTEIMIGAIHSLVSETSEIIETN
jgi:sirohydrochlorin ferrochelatase